jgi:hypothetical protein
MFRIYKFQLLVRQKTSVCIFRSSINAPAANVKSARFDAQTQEDIKSICLQMRNSDFRERIDAIEKFQVLCETATEVAISNIVPVCIR